MRQLADRGVPQEEHLGGGLHRLGDWDSARIFLEVVRCGSFRSAAERLGQSINLVRRRIDDFERQIGATLFTVSRLLSAWENDGLVESGRARIVVRRPDRLSAIAEGGEGA